MKDDWPTRAPALTQEVLASSQISLGEKKRGYLGKHLKDYIFKKLLRHKIGSQEATCI